MRGITKSYGAFKALDAVDLDLRRGEKLVVCGPSGSGKSTLIRCINRLEEPESGLVTIEGQKVGAGGAELIALRRRVGMVFQQFNLFPHLPVIDNITIGPRRLKGMGRAEAADRAIALLERVKLADQAHKLPSQLSGGQQQRVAIARALAMEPVLMLFDEPTSALDPEMIKEVLDVMLELGQQGMSMIVVTHEMGFARRAADRIVFMDKGRIVAGAPPREFFDNPSHPRLRQFLDNILGH
ncbi:MAG: amino acid ABC transporter ATP-binding protein [Aestuariivirga sp.]|uniref:amino acid ABC transporter ATP-binding protein n=1 Tax=Aestuariivirga sp. TaxID=2650926 RepID=UPI0025C2A2C2|nr:amino acid ABC transporter ATP-binding protein [Aestuariivirga sp.]MCA3560861.1 amino acid ABC transporter ATP-binding protein [Aestuariivirga sp.]